MENNNNNKNIFLFLTVGIVNLITFSTGTAYSWSSPVIPNLKSNRTDLNPLGKPIDTIEESWIVSLINLSAALGPFLSGFISNRIGRKRTLQLFSIPMLISYLITSFAQSIELFYLARILLGIGCGCTFSVVPVYVAEISENNNRGLLGCIMAIMLSFGLEFCYLIGPFVNVQLLSLLCLLPLVLFLILVTLLLPESPYYLIAKNDEKNAELSLRKLRTNNNNLTKELEDIKRNVQESLSNIENNINKKTLIKGLVISIGLMIFQQFSGITPVLSNMQSIFNSSGTNLSPDLSVIIIGILQILTIITSSQLIERLGRKILLIISSIGCLIAHLLLGSYFYLKISNNSEMINSLFWLPIFSLIIYIIFYNLGFGPIPWPIMGELFAPNIKAFATTLTSFICLIISFLITLFFPQLLIELGMAQTYWLFSVCCGLGLVFVIVFLPETKGKSLEEIQRILEE